MPQSLPIIDWAASAPVLLLTGTALLVLVVGVMGSKKQVMLPLFISLVGMGATSFLINSRVPGGSEAFNGFLQYDALGRLGAILALAGGILVALISPRTIRLYDLPAPEYFSLLVFGVLGMVLLCLSAELITLILAIEILAVSIYILAGLRREDSRSAEAAFKYFILGAFSSAFLIFGIVFIYGGSGGGTTLAEVGEAMRHMRPFWAIGYLALGLILLLAGFAFKLTLAPFHLYAADVYEGAPTPVAALLATGAKVAGLVALLHVFAPLNSPETESLEWMSFDFGNILYVLAVLSILIGNGVALMQRNIKRMLAYSSVAHSGYLTIGVIVYLNGTVAREQVQTALLIYLVAYVLMNVTAFGVALVLGERGEGRISNYAGLARRSPVLALAMAVAMLSLTGIPATAGFIGKFYIFAAAVKSGFYDLVLIAVFGSVISAYYYLRVIVYMYMEEPAEEIESEPIGLVPGIGLALAVIPIPLIGILPSLLSTMLDVL